MLAVLLAVAISTDVAHKPRHTAVRNGAHTPKHAAVAKKHAVSGDTPEQAVRRFLDPRSPADACAQLSHPYLKRLERRYGPCLVAVQANLRVTQLVISQVVVHGKTATLKANYRMPTGPVAERFSLIKIKSNWLISGAR
jgi:hypothetical protein